MHLAAEWFACAVFGRSIFEAVVANEPEKAAAPAGDPTGGVGGMDF
ncbi:hypothetical protein [Rhodococcus pyridinivorans]